MESEFQPSKLTIRAKLLIIILSILIISLTAVIFIATYFFKDDSEKRIQDTNIAIVNILSQKIESELSSLFFSLRGFANIYYSSVPNSIKEKSFQELLANHKDITYIAFLSIDEKEDSIAKNPRILQEFINPRYVDENGWTTKTFSPLTQAFQLEILKSFNGASVLFNGTPGLLSPILGYSIPWNLQGKNATILVYIDSAEFLRSFQAFEYGKTYMVTDSGMILAHPDTSLVMEATSLANETIVRKMMESKIDNGQVRYLDSQGKEQLGSFRKIWNYGIGIISEIEAEKAFEEVYNIQRRNFIFLIIVLNISIVVVFLYSRTISNPIRMLVGATKEVEKGNFRVPIEPVTRDEVGVLTHSFKHMALGLEEREKVKSILGSMIDPVVVQEAMKDLQALKNGKEEVITAFFSDVAGFSTISEQLTSIELARLLNEYLSAMTIILKKHEGVLDKYIGDAIVAIFNAPVPVPDHPLKAGRASLEMIAKLQELKEYWNKNNLYTPEARAMDVRIGLHVGPAKVGFMGTDDLASYTMMGDTVNLAARLEAAGKDYGVNILVSETFHNHVKSELFTKKLDLVRVKGKNEPVFLYELVASHSDVSKERLENAKVFEEGFECYLKRDWKKAIQHFQEAIQIKGKDKAASLLIERCEYFLQSPPPDDWDGVFTRTTK